MTYPQYVAGHPLCGLTCGYFPPQLWQAGPFRYLLPLSARILRARTSAEILTSRPVGLGRFGVPSGRNLNRRKRCRRASKSLACWALLSLPPRVHLSRKKNSSWSTQSRSRKNPFTRVNSSKLASMTQGRANGPVPPSARWRQPC